MDKVAIFAHYDIDNIIRDYVIYYLKELSKIAKNIIFVSDCNLSENELKKIENIVFHSIAYKHGEYDFGSYKRGYFYAKENNLLSNCEELIFANDSCYGPLYSLHDIWAECDNLGDFWGINLNSYKVPLHVQSFFLVFKKQVFTSEIFDKFMSQIKKEQTKDAIIRKYEINLSQLLIKNNFLPSAYFNTSIVMNKLNEEFLYSRKLNPFIKVSTFKNHSIICVKFICKYLTSKFRIKYPFDLIFNCLNLQRNIKNVCNDLNFIRKSLIRLHLKDKEVYIFGKKYSLNKNKKDKNDKFKGLLPLNLE